MVLITIAAGIVAFAGEMERALARPVAHGQALFLCGAVSPSIACLSAAEVLQDRNKRFGENTVQLGLTSGVDIRARQGQPRQHKTRCDALDFRRMRDRGILGVRSPRLRVTNSARHFQTRATA